MALTGIQIFKHLPKTNCGDCGVPTCLAFAMSLAAGKAELAKCPHVSAEGKAALTEASAPPIRTVEIGPHQDAFKVGGETVLFRHEKTFVNKPGLAVQITDTQSEAEVAGRLARFTELSYTRVGMQLKGELIAIRSTTGDRDRFMRLVAQAKDVPGARLILITEDPELLAAGAAELKGARPLLYAATPRNVEAVGKVAREAGCPVVAKADSLDALAALTEKLNGLGIQDIVLDSGARGLRQAMHDQVHIRRLALLKKMRALGYPTIALPCEMTDDPLKEALYASAFIAKYAGIIVLSDFQGETLFPLLLERLNIYTDPQRPMVAEPKTYSFGAVDERSPLLVTCNFALTHFIVSGEIEASRIPAYLLVVDTEGLSVMTAWAAGKFAGDLVGVAIKKSGFAEQSKSRTVVLPGLAAMISGDLEAEIGEGWKVLIGPREAANITPFLKQIA
ncbi:MAG: acetyl-CoA decarbonylase/synthase complex subunit gamma [Deltaproteobacteria bacterium]|nr:acetyl-CoA decarbonylase/synthase complex subunit gamma [Deltaproteobacteria bacterium]